MIQNSQQFILEASIHKERLKRKAVVLTPSISAGRNILVTVDHVHLLETERNVLSSSL